MILSAESLIIVQKTNYNKHKMLCLPEKRHPALLIFKLQNL